MAEIVDRLMVDSSYHESLSAVVPGGLTEDSLVAALSEFVARLISADSSLDAYLAGDESALPLSARRGLELFRGEAGCIDCHRGPLLSDGKYRRVCVDGRVSRRFYRTPSLRHVASTGPYLHDGSISDLSELVRRHGARCAAEWAPPGEEQVRDLVAFLHGLSGREVEYYPVRIPGRRRVPGDLQEEMDRIDVLMKKNQAAIQAVVSGLSGPVMSATVWTDIAHASVRIRSISRRLRYLFPPQHLHDLGAYHAYAAQLAVSADALAHAARSHVFDEAFVALSELNRTCNGCHALYRPMDADLVPY